LIIPSGARELYNYDFLQEYERKSLSSL
jgi:hypothetical protein